jgi:peptide/nickel transport system substrate-binding protein
MAQNLKAQLAKANITMELDIVEQATYVPRWLAADFATTLANNGGRIDPDTMYTRYFTSTGNLNKVATYSSPTLDANFIKGKTSGKIADRKSAYTAISKELEDNAVWVWLATPYEYRVATRKLRGFSALANGSLLQLRSATLG